MKGAKTLACILCAVLCLCMVPTALLPVTAADAQITNASFETGDLTGWTAVDSTVLPSSTTGYANDGSYVALVGLTKSGNTVSGSLSQEITVTPQFAYSISAFYRQNNYVSGTITADYTLTVTGSDGTVLLTDRQTATTASRNASGGGTFYAGDNTTVTLQIACTATSTVSVGTFQNLVDTVTISAIPAFQNGGFDTSEMPGWTADNAETINTYQIDGTLAVRLGVINTNSNKSTTGSVSQTFAVKPNTTYSVGAFYRQNNGSSNGVTANYTLTVTAADGTVLVTDQKTLTSYKNANVSAYFHTGSACAVTLKIACNATATGTTYTFQNLADAVTVTAIPAFQNGGFDTSEMPGWTADNAETINSYQVDDTLAVRLGVINTNSNKSTTGSVSQTFAVKPDTTYSVGAFYRQNNGSSNGVTANYTLTVTAADGTVLVTDQKTLTSYKNANVSAYFSTGSACAVTLKIACTATATGTTYTFQNLADAVKVTALENFRNGGFDTGDLTGWTATNAATFTGYQIDGTAAVRLGDAVDSGSKSTSGSLSQTFVVDPDTTYCLSAFYRQNNGTSNGVTANYTLTVTGSNGAVLYTDTRAVTSSKNSYVDGTFTTGGCMAVTLQVSCSATSTATTYTFLNMVDAIEVFRAPTVVGAQIRESDNALRFVMKMDQSVLDSLTARYGADKVEFGTVMVNADKFTGSALTVTDKTSGFGSENPTTLRNTSNFVPTGMAYNGSKVYTVVIRKINTPEKQAVSVAVRAYIKVTNAIGGVTVYYSQDATSYGGYATTYAAVAEASQPVA